MIIKSLSRKKPTFEQLYNYITEGAEPTVDGSQKNHFIISKNLYNTEKNSVIQQFKDNSKLLPKRKNGVFLYHEIISFPQQTNISKKKQKEMLINIANIYLEKRINLNLAFGSIHEEKEHLHCHLMISSNEINSPQRQRLSKQEFNTIQKEIEAYKLKKFPELQDRILYNKELTRNKTQTSKSKDRENQFKHRTKTQSKVENIREVVEKTLLSSFTAKDFINNLQKHNFELYIRGNTTGIIDKINDNTKYRFKRLELEEQWQNLLEYDRVRQKEIENIKEIQRQNKEKDRER